MMLDIKTFSSNFKTTVDTELENCLSISVKLLKWVQNWTALRPYLSSSLSKNYVNICIFVLWFLKIKQRISLTSSLNVNIKT